MPLLKPSTRTALFATVRLLRAGLATVTSFIAKISVLIFSGHIKAATAVHARLRLRDATAHSIDIDLLAASSTAAKPGAPAHGRRRQRRGRLRIRRTGAVTKLPAHRARRDTSAGLALAALSRASTALPTEHWRALERVTGARRCTLDHVCALSGGVLDALVVIVVHIDVVPRTTITINPRT